MTDCVQTRYGSWATTGKTPNRQRNIITSLDLDANRQEQFNLKLQRKYREIEENETRFELINCDDADYILVAYGSSSRICQKAVDLCREKGIKVGLLRPITLFPFPTKAIQSFVGKVKGFLTVEMSAGQMVEDVRLAVNGQCRVEHFGHMGGVIPSPNEVVKALEDNFIKG